MEIHNGRNNALKVGVRDPCATREKKREGSPGICKNILGSFGATLIRAIDTHVNPNEGKKRLFGT